MKVRSFVHLGAATRSGHGYGVHARRLRLAQSTEHGHRRSDSGGLVARSVAV